MLIATVEQLLDLHHGWVFGIVIALGLIDAHRAACLMDQTKHGGTCWVRGGDHVEGQRLKQAQHCALAAVLGAVEREIRIGGEHGIEIRADHPESEELAFDLRAKIDIV